MTEKIIAKPSAGFRRRGEQEKAGYINGAIYGDFGIGKTYLAGTIERVVKKDNKAIPEKLTKQAPCPVNYTTLFLNAEQGEEGLPLDCSDIVIKDIYTYKDFSRAYEFLKLHTRFRDAGEVPSLIKLQESYFGASVEEVGELWIFEAVIVDSLTEVQKYCLYQLIGLDQDSKLEDEPDYMQMRQWGTALEMILLMIRNFRALPLHKVFIIQQMEDQDDKKKLFFRPALQGQAKSSILGFFDFVGYYVMQVSMDSTVRRLFLTPINSFKAKHRFEKFKGHYLDNPDMVRLFDARDGKLVDDALVKAKKK